MRNLFSLLLSYFIYVPSFLTSVWHVLGNLILRTVIFQKYINDRTFSKVSTKCSLDLYEIDISSTEYHMVFTPYLSSETLCVRTLSGLQTLAGQLSLLCVWAMVPGHDRILDRHHLEFHHLWPKVGSLSSPIVSYLWWPLILMKLCLIM